MIFRNLLFALLISLSASFLRAQSIEQIKSSGNYYWGEGLDEDPSKASDDALEMLSSSVSVSVSGNTTIAAKSSKDRKSGKVITDENSCYTSLVTTYTQSTLDNCEILSLPEGGKTRVLRYVPKDNVYKLFDQRRRRIDEYLSNAVTALNLNKVDVALKDYSWAYALLLSLPTTSTEEWHGKVLFNYIPKCIDEVLDGIKVSVKSQDDKDFDLLFTYNGKPVHSLDFYHVEDGMPGPLSGAGEGIGEISFLSADIPDKIEIEIEYLYSDQAADAEMRSILAKAPSVKSKHKLKYIPVKSSGVDTSKAIPESGPKTSAETASKPASASAKIGGASIPVPDAGNLQRYLEQMNALTAAITSKTHPSYLGYLMTDSIMPKYRSIINSGNTKVIDDKNLEFTVTERGDVVCRGLVLSFRYRTGRYRSFTRDIVVTFNPQGKISNINMGLGKTSREDIDNHDIIPPFVRQAILEFIETYQTAFSIRDLDYLNTIFDDNAIIGKGACV